MLFPTNEYAIFFLVVLFLAWLLARHNAAHKSFLLFASYLFYGFWSWRYIPLLITISAFAGLVAQRIQQTNDCRSRKRWLIFGIVVCLATLVYYKYTSFLLLSALGLWGLVGRTPVFNLPTPFLPLGISFFTFHAISLMGDVYHRKLRERLSLSDALLYVAFFPQLIAGPILRASHFIPQLTKPRDPSRIRVNRAFLLILAGLFKKVVISNTLSNRLVEPVFTAPTSFNRWDVLLAIYGYAAQIYCDFSGYTDIATGCALLLGYSFPRNFNAPYTAANPQQFWERWHISLSSWLRDYLYIPLGGSREGSARTYRNLLKPGAPVSMKQLYTRYRQGTVKSVRELGHVPASKLTQEEKWIEEYSRPIPIWFQGVWDTVGSLGVPLPLFPKVSRDDFAFLETDLRINNTHAYHALAIDEHREAFKPTLWTKRTPKQGQTYAPRDIAKVEQRWFVGAHANVGGGYEDDLLSQIPLQWLMNKASAHGLEFKDTVVIDGNENTCPIHNSLDEMAHGIYKVVTFGKHFYRSIGAEAIDRNDVIETTINESIDATVFDRWRSDSSYRPNNLVEWAERRKIDPAAVMTSVKAQDMTPLS